jgi:hypothetical protein
MPKARGCPDQSATKPPGAVTIAADRIPLGQRSASELRAQAAAYRRLAATARLIETAAGLLKLPNGSLLSRGEGHGDGSHPG